MFRFLDKCMEDLDNPTQTFLIFRLVTKIHAVQGLGVKDFVNIKGPKVVQSCPEIFYQRLWPCAPLGTYFAFELGMTGLGLGLGVFGTKGLGLGLDNYSVFLLRLFSLVQNIRKEDCS